MKIIFDYNRTLFNPDSGDVFPGVFRLLKTLAPKHELFLITLDKPERKSSAAITEMAPFFKDVVFVERKTVSVFQTIVGQDKNVLIIGDRLEDEIRIGIKLGLPTIHVRGKTPPRLKRFFPRKQRPTHTVPSIDAVLEIIETYEK